MQIKLLDYRGTPTWVEIPDDCQEISGVILSGDMVMEKPFHKDSSNDRIHNFFDGYFTILRKDFEEWNKRGKDSYCLPGDYGWDEQDDDRDE